MGMDSRNEDLTLSPLAKQKFNELVALLAETGFGPDGPSPDTDFATIERFGHRAGRMLGRAARSALPFWAEGPALSQPNGNALGNGAD